MDGWIFKVINNNMANYKQPGYDPSKNGYWKGTVDGAPNFGYPKNYFYADTLRSVLIGFANFFNDLKVIRYNEYGEPVKTINVPIKFGPRMKSHDFRTELESGDKYYISLPNLTYRLDSMQFDSNRAKGIYEQRAFYSDELQSAGLVGDYEEMFWSDVQPTPYNITTTMELKAEKMTDAEQIVEQICARFNPACFFDLKEFWFFNKRRSIKMKLENVNWTIESESMGEEQWRQITVSFSFLIECVLYKPIRDAQIIERINTFINYDRDSYVYHGVTFGNVDGSLTTPYNFSKIYGVKVANAYVLDGNPETTYDPKTSAYTTIYKYKEIDELTTYDADAKRLSATITRWIPANKPEEGPKILHDRPILASADGVIAGYNQKTKEPIYAKKGDVIGYEPLFIDPSDTTTGFNPNVCSITYSGEWMTSAIYEPMNGWGQNNDKSIEFGSKVLIDKDGNPYSAYYSQYSEEGHYTSDSAKYPGPGIDYYYNIETDNGFRPKFDFSGGKYF